jgi:uncharacterized membrane protein
MEVRPAPSSRIASIDVIRGAIMILMALDHVRLYLTNAGFDPMDLSKTSVPLYLTRWVTHFCAPGFVFLAGTGAFLRGRRGSRGSLAGFLLVRGLWLILLELTVVRLGWTFNFDYRHYVLLGVLWMLGWSMVALAGLVFLPYPAIAAFGFLVVFGHNALDLWLPAHFEALQTSPHAWLWQIAYLGGTISAGPDGPLFAVLYSLVPWIGVIALGYAFGRVLTWPEERRRRACLAIGGAGLLLFLVLRGANLYGNPSPWKSQPSAALTVLSFLNTRKYPASLLFLLMTLAPTILAIPLAERLRGAVGRVLEIFGRVPLFFYVLHIWLAHAIAAALSAIRYGRVIPWMFANHPYMPGPHPDGYGYGLTVVWMVTALVAALLYPACRAFAALKAERPGGWLSFL